MPVAATPDDALSVTFGALADPTRRAILARLAEGDATVNQLAALFPTISLQAVSKHLKVLERASLVTRGRSAQQRPAHLRTDPLADATAWLEHYLVTTRDRSTGSASTLPACRAVPRPSSKKDSDHG